MNPCWCHQRGIWLPWPRFTNCCKICGSKHRKIQSMWCVVEISADLNILSFPDDHKESIPVLVRSQNVPNKYNYWLFLHESAENWNSWGISRSWQAMQHCRDSSPAHFWKQWEDGCMAARLCKSIFSFVAEMLTFHLQMKKLRSARRSVRNVEVTSACTRWSALSLFSRDKRVHTAWFGVPSKNILRPAFC